MKSGFFTFLKKLLKKKLKLKKIMSIHYNVKGIKPIKPPSPKSLVAALVRLAFFYVFFIYACSLPAFVPANINEAGSAFEVIAEIDLLSFKSKLAATQISSA